VKSTHAADIDLCVLSVCLLLQRLSNYVAYPWTFVRCHLSNGDSKLSAYAQKLLDIVESKQGDARQILLELFPSKIHHEKVENQQIDDKYQDQFRHAVVALDALARWEFDGKHKTARHVAAASVADARLTKSEGAASSEQKSDASTSAASDPSSDASVLVHVFEVLRFFKSYGT
jgi:hypothetical protein